MAHHGPSLVSERGRPGRRRVARIVRGVSVWLLVVDPHILEFRQNAQDQQSPARPERPERGQNPDQSLLPVVWGWDKQGFYWLIERGDAMIWGGMGNE